MKKRIRLTESRFKRLVFETAKKLLREGIGSNSEFDWTRDFHEGFAMVGLNRKMNFIDTNGYLLSPQWFENADDFHEGFAIVKLNGKYNYIDQNGNYLSKQWFDDATNFSGGLSIVNLNGKDYHIDNEGNLRCDESINFVKRGHSLYKTKKRRLFGEMRNSPRDMFDSVARFSEGFAIVKLNGKYNYIDQNGNLLCKQWFDDASSFKMGYGWGVLNDTEYYIDKQGNLIPCH